MRIPILVPVLVLSMVSTAGAQPNGRTETAVSVLRIPGGGVQPRALAGPGGEIHLVYLSGEPRGADVMYARLPAGAVEFEPPIRVGPPGSGVAIGTIRGPRAALDAHGTIHIAWNGSERMRGPGAAGPHPSDPMLYARSTDGGRTFEPPRNLMTATWELDGGGSVAASGDSVQVVWHGAYKEGVSGDASRGVFIARSKDGGRTFGAEERIAQAGTGACGCCSLAAATDARGRLNILYRQAAENTERGLRLLVGAADGGTFWATPVDDWRTSTCPMTSSGTALGGGRFVLAWETQGQVWIGEVDQASGAMAGRAAAPGPGGQRKHPSLAVADDGRILLAWAEGTGWERGGTVGWQVFDASLSPARDQSGTAPDLPVWGFPAVVEGRDGFLIIY